MTEGAPVLRYWSIRWRRLPCCRRIAPTTSRSNAGGKPLPTPSRFSPSGANRPGSLGWAPRDLFGLHAVPAAPHLSYRRLSRYDETGLVWLLRGRPVVALTESTAAIQNPTGNILTYRKHNKPALGPVGDSLDDLK